MGLPSSDAWGWLIAMAYIDPRFYEPEGICRPRAGRDVFVAPSAVVEGDVELGDQAVIWHHVVLRGDIAAIRVGARSNLQDAVICHVGNDVPCIVEEDVTVGHRAILHACTVRRGALIGMGAIVLDGAVIGEGSIVAAGAVVPPNMEVPAGKMVMGMPGRVARDLTDEERELGALIAAKYVKLAQSHRDGKYLPLRKIDE